MLMGAMELILIQVSKCNIVINNRPNTEILVFEVHLFQNISRKIMSMLLLMLL